MNNLIGALLQRARRTPEQVVLVHGERRVRLAELTGRMCALAAMLRQSGLRGGDCVALVGGNSIEWVEVYLATLAAGGVAVPLNPELRPTDLRALIEHAGARHVYCDSHNRVAKPLMALVRNVVWLVDDADAAAEAIVLPQVHANEPVNSWCAESDLAMILYTSGTTGAPKGVMLGHDSVLQNALDVSEYLELTETDVTLALLPFYYSFGNSVLVTHLLSGARLLFGASFMYPEKMMQEVEAEGVTGLSGVPSMFQLLLQRDLLSDPRWHALRYVAQAGGAMSSALLSRVMTSLPRCKVFVMYGQTEATARICYLPPEYIAQKPNSVGWPMPDTCIQIRDENNQPLPAGQQGLVWVRGPGLMRGYWRDTAATDRVLVDGWLNTGDYGELDRFGFLYIHGRRSDMLKVNGQRLHPQEIEAVINEMPEVAECAVDGVDDDVMGQVPRAFVVLKQGESLSQQALMHYCRSQLAGWKVPRTVVIIDALPKTGSGKVQRHRLNECCINNAGLAERELHESGFGD